MYLYNITINFNPENKSWLIPWLETEIIQPILGKSYFHSHKLYRLFNEVEGTGLTYSLQFFAENEADVQNFRLHHEKEFVEKIGSRLPGDLVYFVSILGEE